MRLKKTKFKITKGEKLLYSIGILSIIATFFITVFGSAKTGNIGMVVEKLKYEVSVETKSAESLEMQINELTSFERINTIVKERNLAYNNNNIIVVND